jgi:hypothetical protein
LLLEVVAAEARVFVHLVCEVEIACLEIALECRRVANFAEQVFEIVAAEDALVGYWRDRAVDADFWWLTFRKVEVGSFGGYQVAEKLVDACHW